MPERASPIAFMTLSEPGRNDVALTLALAVPLVARLLGDAPSVARERLLLLLAALALALAWAFLFGRIMRRPLGEGVPALALGFVLMLPATVPWGAALLALSFGSVFGREIFGARPILPPALLALALGIFAFPAGGFEAQAVFALAPDWVFALSCLAGAVVLLWRGLLAWQVAAGCVLGLIGAGLVAGDERAWEQVGRGAFAAGALFLVSAPPSADGGRAARWLHGLLVGALIALLRHAHPAHPDGVVFAALLGALFAPLLHRALAWRPGRG